MVGQERAPPGGVVEERRDEAERLAQVESQLQGGVRPVVDSTVPLARVGEGLARLARGDQFGKVVAEI